MKLHFMLSGHVCGCFRVHPDGPQLGSIQGNCPSSPVVHEREIQAGRDCHLGSRLGRLDSLSPARRFLLSPSDPAGSERAPEQKHCHLLSVSAGIGPLLLERHRPLPLFGSLLHPAPHHRHFLRHHGSPSAQEVNLYHLEHIKILRHDGFRFFFSTETLPGQALTSSAQQRHNADDHTTAKVQFYIRQQI